MRDAAPCFNCSQSPGRAADGDPWAERGPRAIRRLGLVSRSRLFLLTRHILRFFGGNNLGEVMGRLPVDPDEMQALLMQARAGDRHAFEQLFSRQRENLHQFIDLHLDPRIRARVDTSDVVQEAQMEAFQRLEDFCKRQPMPFHLWLRKTAYERLLKIHRYHIETMRRSVKCEIRLPDRSCSLFAQQLLAGGSSPSKRLSRREIAQLVSQALGQLPETDREILLMRNLDRLSYEEVSCLMEIDAAAARKRYGRALLRLRKLLLEKGLLES